MSSSRLSPWAALVGDKLNRAAADLSSWAKRAAEEAPALSARPASHGANPTSSAASSSSTSTQQPAVMTPEQRVARFRRLLQTKGTLPLDKVRQHVFVEGVPDGGAGTAGLRAVTWKLLLAYLPPDRSQWKPTLAEQRASYRCFCTELTVDPQADSGAPAAPTPAPADLSSDHPLTDDATSKWVEWHADEELRAEIQKDVDRTLPDYSFFNREQPLGRLHHAAISRVLFIYAKLNPGIRYVQGMNEVLAPIYYVFCQEVDDAHAYPAGPPAAPASGAHDVAGEEAVHGEDPLSAGTATSVHRAAAVDVCDGETTKPPGPPPAAAAAPGVTTPLNAGRASPAPTTSEGSEALPGPLLEALEAVEADAFFCFTHLMAEIRDHFCSKLDHTEIGITAKITRMEKLLESKDPDLGRRLKALKVAPTFYGFRWITLLMTQEWDLPDVLRLWDSLLADPSRFDFLLYFAVATVTSIRTALLEHDDFAYAVKALQRFDGRVPMHALLRRAHKLYAQEGHEGQAWADRLGAH